MFQHLQLARFSRWRLSVTKTLATILAIGFTIYLHSTIWAIPIGLVVIGILLARSSQRRRNIVDLGLGLAIFGILVAL
jgi:uncharacterized membrane protein YiaA